jgi:2-dehydro-3-deoxygluconokinase
MCDVVSFGETMVMMDPVENGPIKYIHSFRKKIGGAESNFAIGLSRLGHDAGWFSKLGDDPSGAYVRSVIAGERVDTEQVMFTDEAPTGVMFKERISRTETHVHYNRTGSAASRMTPDELPDAYIKDAQHLHITGITPILSSSCRKTVDRAFQLASDSGVRVSFDPNVRMKLWEGEETRETLIEFIERAEVVIISVDEADQLFDERNPDRIADRVLSERPKLVAVTMDEEGARAFAEDDTAHHPGFEVDVVDTVGAGDAFCAGFVSAVQEEQSLEEMVVRANLCGAHATTVPGDMEGLPTREDLASIREGSKFLR